MRERQIMSQTERLVTAEEFARIQDDGYRYELVEGRIIKMSPPGFRHGMLAVRLTMILGEYLEDHDLGELVIESGCRLARDPDTVRGPDLSFVRRDRIPRTGAPEGFWPGAPDLVIEIRSPGDTLPEVDTKVDDYLSHGVRLVWAVDSRKQTVTVYRPLTAPRTLTIDDELDGAEVLPGFRCRVAEIFRAKPGRE